MPTLETVRTLMTGIIDYAGLFPPAKLEMASAVEQYAAHRTHPHAWMLARFICPVTRFGEFAAAAGPHLARISTSNTPGSASDTDDAPDADDSIEPNPDRWKLSALIPGFAQLDDGLEAATTLEQQFGDALAITAAEMRVAQVHEIDDTADAMPEGVDLYFEIPLDGDYRGHLAAIAGVECGAKIRCGGVTADLFPSPETVATFIARCRDAQVPFKATAGLHHPIRHHNDSVNTKMHGFLNVFGAAILARTKGLGAGELQRVLEAEDPAAFAFTEREVRILDWTVDLTQIERGRTFAVGYGSCSFEEPVEDLQGLGLLDKDSG